MSDVGIWALWILGFTESFASVCCAYSASDFAKTWPQTACKAALSVLWLAAAVRLFIPLFSGIDPAVSWFGASVLIGIGAVTIIEAVVNGVYRFRCYGRRSGDIGHR